MKLQEIAKSKKIKKVPNIKGVKESKATEVQYHKLLKQLANELKKEVRENILPLLKTSSITTDSTIDILAALANLAAKFADITGFANSTANIVVENVDKINRKKFINNVNNAVGVDLEHIIESEGLNDLVALQKSKNVALIKSIPQEFHKNIEVIVQNGISNGARWETIAKEISGIKNISSVFGKLDNRIKHIARQETAMINGALTKARQENLGVFMYVFRTSKDERVRESHAVMEGKICKWDNPTLYKDKTTDTKWKKRSSIGGVEKHPSFDFNCRCYGEGIIK